MARSGSRRRSPMARARRGADHVVLVEVHAAAHHPPRLGLGHVVQQRGQLQHTPAVERAAEALAHVGGQLFAERARARRAGASRRSQASTARSECSSTSKRCGAGCGARRIGADLGQHHLQHAERGPRAGARDRSRARPAAPRARRARARRRHARQPGRRGTNGARRRPASAVSPSVASRRTARSARSGSSARTPGPAGRRRRARRSARPPVGSTMPAPAAASSAARGTAERVDGEVAGGQITGEIGRAEVVEVELQAGRRPPAPRRARRRARPRWRRGAVATRSASASAPAGSATSRSATGRPSRASRTAPPTSTGRPRSAADRAARHAAAPRPPGRGGPSVSSVEREEAERIVVEDLPAHVVAEAALPRPPPLQVVVVGDEREVRAEQHAILMAHEVGVADRGRDRPRCTAWRSAVIAMVVST